jgi:hypothetical protein
MALDQAAILGLMDSTISHGLALGVFDSVNGHEPKSSPGSGMTYAVWADSIVPLGGASGLSATSGEVVLMGRIYTSMLQKPEDGIDPDVLTAATTLMGAYSGDFNFGATVRNVDLLGAFGPKLSAQAGYVTISGSMFRVMTLTIPVIFNDMWSQVA